MTEDIIQATAAVKAKYKQLKEERAARQEEATSALQPLIEPLKKMVPAELGEEIFTDDANFGPRFVNGKYYMGNKRYVVTDQAIKIGRLEFPRTEGLLELIHRRVPNKDLITPADETTYGDILKETQAHAQTTSFKSHKYTKYIKRLTKITGRGLVDCNRRRKKINLPSDPNDQCERLRLLVASSSAGHTGHEREISAIISKLRATGYIL